MVLTSIQSLPLPLLHALTCAHTHTCNTKPHARAHTQPHAHRRTHTHTHAHTRTHTLGHTHTHTRTAFALGMIPPFPLPTEASSYTILLLDPTRCLHSCGAEGVLDSLCDETFSMCYHFLRMQATQQVDVLQHLVRVCVYVCVCVCVCVCCLCFYVCPAWIFYWTPSYHTLPLPLKHNPIMHTALSVSLMT